jgi:hypothetical protein
MGSVPAMRIGEYAAWVMSSVGSAFVVFNSGWLAGLTVLVVGTLLTFVISDIRREGGLPRWMIKLVSVGDAWDEYKSRHVKRREKRKEEALRQAQRRAELKRKKREGR